MRGIAESAVTATLQGRLIFFYFLLNARKGKHHNNKQTKKHIPQLLRGRLILIMTSGPMTYYVRI